MKKNISAVIRGLNVCRLAAMAVAVCAVLSVLSPFAHTRDQSGVMDAAPGAA
jgi:hypothetical protein